MVCTWHDLQDFQAFAFKLFRGELHVDEAAVPDGRLYYGLAERQECARADGARYWVSRFYGKSGTVLAEGIADDASASWANMTLGWFTLQKSV